MREPNLFNVVRAPKNGPLILGHCHAVKGLEARARLQTGCCSSIGKPASWKLLHALGSKRALHHSDPPYRQYANFLNMISPL